jgi:hypothetical protein
MKLEGTFFILKMIDNTIFLFLIDSSHLICCLVCVCLGWFGLGPIKTQIFFQLKLDSELVEELDFSEIQFEEKIGEGSYGRVYKGKWRGLAVAIKGFHFKEDFEKERTIFK